MNGTERRDLWGQAERRSVEAEVEDPRCAALRALLEASEESGLQIQYLHALAELHRRLGNHSEEGECWLAAVEMAPATAAVGGSGGDQKEAFLLRARKAFRAGQVGSV